MRGGSLQPVLMGYSVLLDINLITIPNPLENVATTLDLAQFVNMDSHTSTTAHLPTMCMSELLQGWINLGLMQAPFFFTPPQLE